MTFCNVSIQLKDLKGTNMACVTAARVWLSATAAGAVGLLPSGNETVQQGVQLHTVVAKGHWIWLSTATGTIAFRINNTTTPRTYYVNVEVNGKVFSSNAILFEGLI